MANLSSTSATNSQVNEVHSNDNQIFDNVDYQLSQEMHQEEHLDSDAETKIDGLFDSRISIDYLDEIGIPKAAITMNLQQGPPSEDVLVHQVVSMKKMSEKPGHVRPANGFYEKLNALKFVPQRGTNLAFAQIQHLEGVECSSTEGTPQDFQNRNHTETTVQQNKRYVLVEFVLQEPNCNESRELWPNVPLSEPFESGDQLDIVVGSVKPQWKPTGRHFALYDNCPLTRIMEPIVEPLELTPSVSSSSKVTMISRSKGRTVADSIAERLTRPTAYKFKTDCSIIPVWVLEELACHVPENLSRRFFEWIYLDHRRTQSNDAKDLKSFVCHIHTTVLKVIKKALLSRSFPLIFEKSISSSMQSSIDGEEDESSKLSKIPNIFGM
ncbi:hypothetical protein Tco_0687066 [Tanacetum coccineum]